MVTMASMTRALALAADLALALGTELGAEQAPEVGTELAVALLLALDMAPAVVTGWALSRLAQVRLSCSITFSTLGVALHASCALVLCLSVMAVHMPYVHPLCEACRAVYMCCSHRRTSSDCSCMMWLHSCALYGLDTPCGDRLPRYISVAGCTYADNFGSWPLVTYA